MQVQINLDEETHTNLKHEKINREKVTLAETAEEILAEALND